MGDRSDAIEVRGAQTHNLKNIDVDIPRDRLVVITGRSGSGKSSLAFDTVFASGQREFFDSQPLSTRQHLRHLPRPAVVGVTGLPPTLCLDQQPASASPRSTVGTITEIYDYLRLLMAHLGEICCYGCDRPIQQQSPAQIAEQIMRLPAGSRMMILAPVVEGQVGSHEEVLKTIRRERLVRVRIDGEIHDIDRVPPLASELPHSIAAVTDRIIIKPDIENRLHKAIELAVQLSRGAVIVSWIAPEEMDAASKNDPRQWHEKLYSTVYACPECDIHYQEVEPRTFSFNSPYGACEQCDGLGFAVHFDPSQVIQDDTRSIEDRGISVWDHLTKSAYAKQVKQLQPILNELDWPLDRPINQMPAESIDRFFYHHDRAAPGLMLLLEKELATSLDDDWCDRLIDMETRLPCNHCGGSRLNRQANSVYFHGKNISTIVDLPLKDALAFIQSIELSDHDLAIGQPLLEAMKNRLNFLVEVGADYLTLGRIADTLSGGEYQRVRLAASMGTGLTNVCYVLDEPSIGLHQRDSRRLIDAMMALRDAGNTLIIVEHDEEMIRSADHIIDMGPGAGTAGGTVVAAGTVQDLAIDTNSITGMYLQRSASMAVSDNGASSVSVQSKPASGAKSKSRPQSKPRPIDADRQVVIAGATGFNLKSVDVEIPLGVMTCVTGVSGSGKSTLINQTLVPAMRRHLGLIALPPAPHRAISGLEYVDSMACISQRAIGRSPRSCPATYTGILDELRKLFAATKIAKSRGYTASRFSFNSKTGRCDHCAGQGMEKVRLKFLPDVFSQCPVCRGRRYNPATLQAKFGGFSIADVLEMTIDQALRQFEGFSKIRRTLECLSSVGLGYLQLGQSATTLSGGESQRIKLASELASPREGHTVYVLDEPTTGLHMADVADLLLVLDRIVEQKNSVIVIEHNLDVIKTADWIIDLGPEGGDGGGTLVACGTPATVAQEGRSPTGRCLRSIGREGIEN